MNYEEELDFLINCLLEEMPEYEREALAFSESRDSKRRLLRSLMNLRSPGPLNPEFIRVQDSLLSLEREERMPVSVDALPEAGKGIVLWQGDITRLEADAIVNAANNKLLGCFAPCHACIDNVIHSAAGLQLREDCHTIMKAQGYDEPTGQVKVTKAYNLPSKYVFHTVGPIVYGNLTDSHCSDLKACYLACLEAALEMQLQSLVFCCISTGEYRFPNKEAARIAIATVNDFFAENMNSFFKENSSFKVIFNVFKDIDYEIYRELLES